MLIMHHATLAFQRSASNLGMFSFLRLRNRPCTRLLLAVQELHAAGKFSNENLLMQHIAPPPFYKTARTNWISLRALTAEA
jgi:hypothetical protein